MKTAVLYLRVSTAEQAATDYDPEGYSIPAQREACRRKAESMGVEVADEYLDLGASARSADRPELQHMLKRIKERRDIDYVIVHKVDRLARSRLDDVYINLALKEAGARLVSVMENIDETPSGMMLHGIMATFAEFYSLNLATEIKKGMGQKAKVGGTATRAPIGYLNVREIVDGREIRTVRLDPDRASLVRWAFQAYATGDYSLNRLLDELTEKGLTIRATLKQPERPMRLSGLSRMLHNAYYAGIVSWKGVEYPGRHDPLIGRSLYNQVQGVLKAHDLAGERSRVHHHYLKGSTFCGKCGARLGLHLATGKSGGKYLYFFCSNRHQGGPCSQRYLLADKVEQAINSYYATLTSRWRSDLLATVRREALAHFAEAERSTQRQTDQLRRRRTKLERERKKLLEAYYADAIDVGQLKAEQERLGRQMASVEEQSVGLQANAEQLDRTLELVLGMAGQSSENYRLAAPLVRRQLNQVFFSRLLIEEDEDSGGGWATAELNPPFAQLQAHLDARRQRQGPGSSKEDDRGLGEPCFVGQGSSKTTLVDLSCHTRTP